MKRRGSKLILSAILMIFYTYNYDIDVTPFLHTSDDYIFWLYTPLEIGQKYVDQLK